MKTLRVLLADDHTLVLAGLRLLLEQMEGTLIVGEASDGRQAVALALEHRPDLVIMDISMRELNGIDATIRIRAEMPATRILILSSHTTEDFVRRAIDAGVSGYLVKGAIPMELKMAVEAVSNGKFYLSPEVADKALAGVGRGAAGALPLDALSPRQREVLQMIAEGKSTKEIAFRLEVSVKTVETHRAAIMERLGIRDIAGLVVFAARNGLIDLDRG